MSRSRKGAAAAALWAALFAGAEGLGAQGVQDLHVVESPTAGILGHGAYRFEGAVGPGSDLLFSVGVGFHDRLQIGMSFGLQNFIGRGEIEINDRPGFQARLRVLEESYAGPAFALGVDTQGEGCWIEDDERYERKSCGVYGALSKNYYALRNIGLHGGINYSFEKRDEESIDLFAGLTIEVFSGMSLLLDYDASFDDDDETLASTRTRGRGYLDAGARFDFGGTLSMRLLFKDLTGNYAPERGVARTLEIFYTNWF
ncbi:MAG: hypothetical protein PHQ19_04420 [Candidatus Krumholzibacteria bacterium]|nr:hypothetical protein [Candidatus Krumholzibacteria bacterium]